jgi:hypothetical protein
MDKLTLYQSPQITVWCYPGPGIIQHQMHDYCYGAPFRAGLEAGAQALRQYGAHSWLSDDRANGAIPSEDEEWGRTVWFPSARAAGWRNWALVKPETAVGRLNVQRILANFRELGVNAQFFPDVERGFTWLRGLATPLLDELR